MLVMSDPLSSLDVLFGPFFKDFIEFVTILLLSSLMFLVFGHKACGILAPQPGVKTCTPFNGR